MNRVFESKNLGDAATFLKNNGYCLLYITEPEYVPDYKAAIMKYLKYVPELKQITDESSTHIGGFGTLALPSSFHNKSINHIRENCNQFIELLLKHFLLQNPTLVEDGFNYYSNLFDRLSIRVKGTEMAAESPHRDLSPHLKGNIIFGGWMNCGLTDSYFTCYPGDYILIERGENVPGFNRQQVFNPDKKVKVIVRPGIQVIFFQSLLHEISTHKITSAEPQIKVYLGYMLSKTNRPAYNNLEQIMDERIVPRLKSNQKVLMAGGNHRSALRNKQYFQPTVKFGLVKRSTVDFLKQFHYFPENFQPEDRLTDTLLEHPSLNSLNLAPQSFFHMNDRLKELFRPKKLLQNTES